MKKALIVAKWEYLERIKTKTFIISLLVTPAIIIGFALAPTFLSGKQDISTKVIGVIDTSEIYFKPLVKSIEKFKLNNGQPNYLIVNLSGRNKDIAALKKSADDNALSGKLEGYLTITFDKNDSTKLEYRSKNSGNFQDLIKIEEAFNNARIEVKLTREGINPELMKFISEGVQIKPIKIERGGNESHSDFLTLFFTSFIFIVLLMMMVLSSGGMLIRSLVEEKSNRLIEILVSSCTPNELLAGKVIGLSALGITQVLVWSLIGISLAGSALISTDAFNYILPILFYFALGFIFYSAIFIGIGSIVSTEQEAQQITFFLNVTLMLPIVIVLPAIENPDSIFVHVLSYIPFTIPAVMILRFNIGPIPVRELIISTIIMITSIIIVVLISGKIFRIGILSYGKRPSLKELMHWINGD